MRKIFSNQSLLLILSSYQLYRHWIITPISYSLKNNRSLVPYYINKFLNPYLNLNNRIEFIYLNNKIEFFRHLIEGQAVKWINLIEVIVYKY